MEFWEFHRPGIPQNKKQNLVLHICIWWLDNHLWKKIQLFPGVEGNCARSCRWEVVLAPPTGGRRELAMIVRWISGQRMDKAHRQFPALRTTVDQQTKALDGFFFLVCFLSKRKFSPAIKCDVEKAEGRFSVPCPGCCCGRKRDPSVGSSEFESGWCLLLRFAPSEFKTICVSALCGPPPPSLMLLSPPEPSRPPQVLRERGGERIGDFAQFQLPRRSRERERLELRSVWLESRFPSVDEEGSRRGAGARKGVVGF